MRHLYKWIGIFLAVNGLDALTTYVGMSALGAEETNPLMGYLWARSPALFLTVKILAPILLLEVMARRTKNPRRSAWIIQALSIVFFITVLWNMVVMYLLLS